MENLVEEEYLHDKLNPIMFKTKNNATYIPILKGDNGNWKKGAKVEKILVDGVYYLKTVANNTKKDNLENLPEY